MQMSYSIVEARNNFASLVRDAEQSRQPVRVTRRNQAVAVILSIEEYERLLKPPKVEWMSRYLAWREKWGLDEVNIDPDEIWGDTRDKSLAGEANPWL